MNTKQLILSYSFFFLIISVNSQQTNNWYFGGHLGLSFNPVGNSFPTPVFNSAMNAPEGCSAISDKSGSLLFYTNGVTVYNRNHQVMLNGDNLSGHSSAFQSSVIVPVPNTDSLFYIFTSDASENNYANGYRYSIVNMKHDNGKGEMITKNVLLYSPCCERLTAARHGNGVDVWVITNDKGSNIFRAWLITCNGLQPSPVISTVGAVLNQTADMFFGCMKVSPDGKQLCQTHFPVTDGFTNENFFQLFDFNNVTGIISNPIMITVPNNQYYACEYSPDSKLLYVSKAQSNEIDQFESTLGTAGAITSSRIPIPADFGFYGLQLAPDNRIYVSRLSSLLSAIDLPDKNGVGCNFEKDKISLGGYCGINLPACINDLATNNNIGYQVMDSCNTKVQFFGLTTMGGILQWFWDFGDGVTSTLQNPLHIFSSNQLQTVKLKITSSTECGLVERSINFFPGGAFADADFDFAPRCDSDYVRFINKSILFPEDGQYIWDFGDGSGSTQKDPIHSYTTAGNFVVRLKAISGQACFDDSATKTLNLQLLNIQAPPDQVVDEGRPVQLFVTGGGSSFSWSPTTWLSDPTAQNPVATPFDDIMYIVTASNDAGCKDVDSVFIHVNPMNDIFVPSAFTPDNDGLNDMLRPFFGLKYSLIEFTIYNRWGEKIFITSEKGKGWDGKLNGRLQSPGSYVWSIKVKNKDGKIIQKTGVVTLIR
jgi:gliding motility-associated-like protein